MSASMDCRGVRASASGYVDGVLDARSRGVVQEHLRDCGECLAVYRENLSLARAARGLPREPAPFDLAARVRERWAHRRGAVAAALVERRPAVSMRAAIAAAVLVIAIVLGFVAGRCSQPTLPSAAVPLPGNASAGDTNPSPRAERPVDPPARPTRLTPAIDAVPAGGPVRRSGR